ncbi:MAG: tRNA splicing endonuclease subunit sen2 [Chrysothrix sp. TS-e1954]|nr:MAG: tRNA splicing endonuclease subunit sen2 [Chrysothrix sp. TS-e1954]
MATTTRRPYTEIHKHPLPLRTHPLPAFIPHNPLSILRLAYALLTTVLNPPTSHSQIFHAYYSSSTNSVHVTDPVAVRALWEQGFFGKGSLSRSEPEWLEREEARARARVETGNGGRTGKETAGEVTRKRREERKREKRERARKEAEELEEQLRKEGKLAASGEERESQSPEDPKPQSNGGIEEDDAVAAMPTNAAIAHQSTLNEGKKTPGRDRKARQDPLDVLSLKNLEHLQLTPDEAFFLSYGLGCLVVHKSPASTSLPGSDDTSAYSNLQLLQLFSSNNTTSRTSDVLPPDDPFLLHYVVYHHFRSLGWVVRPGIKFAVDFLLYARGPVFAHAEFAVLVLPSYSKSYWTERDSQGNLMRRRKADESQQWWWLHNVNRVQNQVRKSLVLVWVEVPEPLEQVSSLRDAGQTGHEQSSADIAALLKRYSVKEFVIGRWTANRQR